MEKEQILKGNLLIAKFLGFEKGKGFLGELTDPEEKSVDGWKTIYNPDGSDFHFHDSLDKLQRALKPIEEEYWVFTSTRPGKDGVKQTETSIVTLDPHHDRLVRTKSNDKVESVWLAVIEYIKLLES